MWSNFHTHSKYCDGKGDLKDHLTSARGNIISLGFSSHAPLPFDSVWCMKKEELNSYLGDIKTLSTSQHEIEIYAGLEIDFIPGVVSPDDFKNVLDYTIGSIHFVDAIPGGHRWEIDGSHAGFLEGLEKIFENDFRAAVMRYFDLMRAMILEAPPDIIGHMDKIKIQNVDGKFFDESDAWYKDEINRTLKLIKDSGIIVEVNTRGIYKKKSATTYPSPWILEKMLDLNIPITLNSDAHHSDDLIKEFGPAAFMLKNMGFKNLTILKEGMWKPVAFDQAGIIL